MSAVRNMQRKEGDRNQYVWGWCAGRGERCGGKRSQRVGGHFAEPNCITRVISCWVWQFKAARLTSLPFDSQLGHVQMYLYSQLIWKRICFQESLQERLFRVNAPNVFVQYFPNSCETVHRSLNSTCRWRCCAKLEQFPNSADRVAHSNR